MTATIDDLRARCPRCHKDVPVRRQDAAWRMAPHKRSASVSWSYRAREVACAVRGIDAAPMIAEWFARAVDSCNSRDRSAATAREEAARLVASADAMDARSAAERERLDALRALATIGGAP